MTGKKANPEPLKWGLISTARINRALIKSLRLSDRNQLVAVASRKKETVRDYAEEWDIPHAFDSYQAMLDDTGIDVVYNSLPNSLHAEWTIKALQAGKHVLCEKPLAISLEEVDAMQVATQESGCYLTEAFMYRHHPQTLQVKRLVQSGAVGDVRLVKGEFTFNIKPETNVRLSPDLGGGSIWDVGCYPISYTRYVLGNEPVKVFGWQVLGSSGVDEVFAGQMLFPGGIMAQFDSGFRSPYRSRMEIVGSESALIIPQPFNPGNHVSLTLWDGENSKQIPVENHDLYLGEIEDIASTILDGTPPRISLEDSRRNIHVILALLQSAASGQPVVLNDI